MGYILPDLATTGLFLTPSNAASENNLSFTRIQSGCIVLHIMWLISSQGNSVAQLWGQLGITLLILAIMAVLSYVTVRFLKPKLNPVEQNHRMTLVAKLPLEPRRAIYLVKVDDRELAVGVSEAGMELLSELPNKSEIAECGND